MNSNSLFSNSAFRLPFLILLVLNEFLHLVLQYKVQSFLHFTFVNKSISVGVHFVVLADEHIPESGVSAEFIV